MSAPLVQARGLVKHFERRNGLFGGKTAPVQAVSGVDLEIREGETVGLVGESGSGKSTLGRMLIRLIDPDQGTLHFDGTDLLELKGRELRAMRRQFQIVFQDPFGSLNPRMRVGTAIGEPMLVHGLAHDDHDRQKRVEDLMEQVGLDPDGATRYPHEFSGGQRQRIGIARAIACNPRFVVADEPVSALDPPVQAQIVNLMVDLQERMGLSYLFIGHDLALIEHVCDRVLVMYLGRIVEEGPAKALYAAARHPYTQALLASTPQLAPGEPTLPALAGEPPSPTDPPSGCPFHPRCPLVQDRCRSERPVLREIVPGQRVACHLVED